MGAWPAGCRPFIAGFGDTPGETVEVTFRHTKYPTTVGADGNWEVQMNCCDKLVNQTLTVAVRLLPAKPCRTRKGDKEWRNGRRAPTPRS